VARTASKAGLPYCWMLPVISSSGSHPSFLGLKANEAAGHFVTKLYRAGPLAISTFICTTVALPIRSGNAAPQGHPPT
jgi:hypothetical protein